MPHRQGQIQRGLGGLQPPYCWCINGNMGRVREKKRWKKEEKIERWWKKKRSAPPSILFCIRHCS